MDFKRNQDPIKSMGLGFGKKAETKAWKILEFIKAAGEEGRRFTDIQHFIWTELQGYTEEGFWEKDHDRYDYKKEEMVEPGLRSSRGYYTTILLGTGWFKSHRGLLTSFCRKNDKGRWVLDRMPKPGENLVGVANESFQLVPESLNEIFNNRYIK